MVSIYERAKDETGYTATRFIQMVSEHGGVEAARRLLALPEASGGWTALYERGRLDLTVECHVLRDEFAPLFTDAERAIAAEWLERYGFDPERCRD